MVPSSPAARLRQVFRDRTILTMDELKAALDMQVAMTVFGKLRRLSYLSSYSHRGKYYTLAEIARFDQLGLWSHSHHGALTPLTSWSICSRSRSRIRCAT